MDSSTFEILELEALLGLVARHVQTPMGRTRIQTQRPMTDRAPIERSLDLTAECVRYIDAGQRFGLSGIEDPHGSLDRLQVEGTVLEPQGVLDLERLVSVGMGIRDLLRRTEERQSYPQLAAVAGGIPDLRSLLAQIKGKVLPGGELDDGASPELRSIRREIQAGRGRIHRALESVLRQQARAVQEDIITFRNGRFVIPVRTDSRVHVPGVVHGLSSSGQTTFVEPLSVIDQNNDIVRLREQEEMEITRILLAISDAFRARRPALLIVAAALAEIDAAQARARFALEFDCVRPRFSDQSVLELTEARHVLLDHSLRQSGAHAVPISLALDAAHQVLVISGPNAGGKTVVLKTVGLLALMAQMGLYVPARQAVLPLFDQVFADIGDQQSIEANLSTFTAHMRNVAAMARRVAPPALLLLDEVGTGTDPEEGSALGISIVDYFRRAGATTLATTHYNPLKMWAMRAEGVLNASVEFDLNTLRPTYRLIMGIAGASSGIEIARRMQVPDDILSQAAALSGPDHTLARDYLERLKTLADDQEGLRAALQEERAAAVRERERLHEEYARREASRSASFEEALARASSEFQQQSEQLIKGLKDRVAMEKLRRGAQNRAAELRRSGREATLRIRSETGIPEASSRAHPGSTPPETVRTNTPQEGDRVWVRPLGQAGTVLSIREDVYAVGIGSLTFRAKPEDLQVVAEATAPAAARAPSGSATTLNLDEPFVPELKVIGMTADEAIQRVDKFLDESFLAGVESIRIIHGHGKGILRRAIAELLTDHPQVESFHPAPPNQGGGGATVVELRK